MKRIYLILLVLCGPAAASYSQMYDPSKWTNIRVNRLPDEIHSKELELPGSFTPSGNILYFSTKRKGPDQVWTCKYEYLSFIEPTSIHDFSRYSVGAVTIDSAGKTYLAMRNPLANRTNTNDINLYEMDFKEGKLNELPSTINTDGWESQPHISKDGRTLYYSAVADKPNSKPDIFVSEHGFLMWQPGEPIDSINTEDFEGFPVLSPDEQFLFFTRISGLTRALYWSRKIGDTWSKPELLPEPINSGREMAIAFHPTERMFVIGSARVSKIRMYNYDLYEVRYDLKE
jgi:hypothetical protein